MFFTAFLNFLSHFVVPDLLMYAKHIKVLNTLNLVVVGCVCLIVLVTYRFNDAANFCTGSFLTEEEKQTQLDMSQRQYLIERGGFLRVYTSMVITISGLFISIVTLFCLCNLKKMGF